MLNIGVKALASVGARAGDICLPPVHQRSLKDGAIDYRLELTATKLWEHDQRTESCLNAKLRLLRA